MKKFYRKLALTCLGATMASFCGVSCCLWQLSIRDTDSSIKQLLAQADAQVEQVEKEYQDKISLLKKDYLNRAFVTEMILRSDEKIRTPNGMEILADTMQVDGVYAIDSQGKVCISSKEDMVGRDLQEDLLLLEEKEPINGEVYEIIFENSDFYKAPADFHILIQSDSDLFSAIRMDIDEKKLGLVSRADIIREVLNETPTDFDTALCAVDGSTGQVIGLTKNNKQTLLMGENFSGHEISCLMKRIEEGKVYKTDINHSLSRLTLTEREGYYLLAYRSLSKLISEIVLLSALILVLMLAVTMGFIWMLKHFLNENLFSGLNEMQGFIEEILQGNFKAEISQTVHVEELQPFMKALTLLQSGYVHKAERTDKIFSVLGEEIAVFEYLSASMEAYYISENLKAILNLSSSQWETFRKDKRAFQSYLEILTQKMDKSHIVCHRGRYLEIHAYDVNNEFVGVVIDRTADKYEEERLRKELTDTRAIASIDKLTGLYNRSAFEEYIISYLESPNLRGTMIMMDLDNFKRINDYEGHPEGDKVLHLFGEILTTEFRRNDFVARLGGDEFIVLTDGRLSRSVLELKLQRLLNRVQKELFYYYENYEVSVSIGAVDIDGTIPLYNTLYACVDTALYIAKHMGKNQYYINDEKIYCMKRSGSAAKRAVPKGIG